MSLTCHEIIGRVGRVGRGCYEDASDLSVASRACRVRGLWRTTRHTDKRAALHRSRPPADQSGKRAASWAGKSPGLSRECYEENGPVEFKLCSAHFVAVRILICVCTTRMFYCAHWCVFVYGVNVRAALWLIYTDRTFLVTESLDCHLCTISTLCPQNKEVNKLIASNSAKFNRFSRFFHRQIHL